MKRRKIQMCVNMAESENENIGVNPYLFEPYDIDSSSSQTKVTTIDWKILTGKYIFLASCAPSFKM